MFFKSDRGVRCALKSSRSVFCDDVFFATIVFFATVLLFWLDKPPRSGKHGVFGVTVCFLRRCVFCDGVFLRRCVFCEGVCFSDAVFVANIRSCILLRGPGVVSFGGRVFFATLCLLRRSVGVFCVDQKCFLHSESVSFASQRVFCDREQGL